MKVSKRQLRRLIKKERRKLVTEAYTLYDDDGGEWEEYESLDDVKAELKDLSSRMDTDDWEVEDPEGNRVPVYKLEEGKSTRTTKRQLTRIIREEKQMLLTENSRIIGGIGFHSHQTPKTNVPYQAYNNGYRKPPVAEQHDPLDPFADSTQLDKLDYALQLIEKHQKQMPETSPDLAIAIGMLSELWEDLHVDV